MSRSSQNRAVENYRERLEKRGMARFEVIGLESDRDLIRSLARHLANNDADAVRIRSAVVNSIEGEPAARGGLLRALRNSPLVGADLDLTRTREPDRKIDL